MDKLSHVDSIAVPMPQAAIDTDMILPAQFLLRVDRAGLGQFAFHEARQAAKRQGEAFVLDEPGYQGAHIIVGGPRFGIGSSREQAVWALFDAGIKAVIAPDFGEIFYANCFNNGIAALAVQPDVHSAALTAAQNKQALHIDITRAQITIPGYGVFNVELPEHHRQALLQGLDQTAVILNQDADAISDFEAVHQERQPWLTLTDAQLESVATRAPK